MVIDAVGRPETWKQAFYARDLAGTVVLVGVPTPDMKIPDLPLIDVFGRGGALKSSWYGDCLPSRDFPMLVDLYQQGRLDLDAFVTEEIALDDVEAAFEKMQLRRRAALGGDPVSVRVDHAVSSGTFSLDGETFEVDNNVWVIGDDDECIVIDAPHDVDDILAVVGGRTVKAILCTHAHDDHVRVAPELRERVSAPILLHPADRPVWELTHTDHLWDVDLDDGQTVKVGGAALKVLHTPGHAPGAVCLYVARPRLRLHRRHPLPGRPGRHRPLVQRRGPDQGVDRGQAVRAARRDRRTHRPRRRHHHRSRARGPGVSQVLPAVSSPGCCWSAW